MKIKTVRQLFVMAFLFLVIKGHSQEHKNSWFRATLSIPVTFKVNADIELQHRRQNDFQGDTFLDKNLMYTFRTWLYYKHSEGVVFAVSPFAYFSHYKIIQDEADARAKPTHEYRFSASVELQHELANKLFIVDKTAMEYRIFEGTITNVARIRNRLALRYEFNPNYSVTVGDELLCNAWGTDAQHIFDHNRLFTQLSFKPQRGIKLDIGYLYVSRLTKSSTDLLKESNGYFNFTYTLPKHKAHGAKG